MSKAKRKPSPSANVPLRRAAPPKRDQFISVADERVSAQPGRFLCLACGASVLCDPERVEGGWIELVDSWLAKHGGRCGI